jgi:hypothetical protein
MGAQDESFDPDCASAVDELEAGRILDTYVGAPGLLPALRFWVTNQKVARQLLDGVERDATALMRRVDAALER